MRFANMRKTWSRFFVQPRGGGSLTLPYADISTLRILDSGDVTYSRFLSLGLTLCHKSLAPRLTVEFITECQNTNENAMIGIKDLSTDTTVQSTVKTDSLWGRLPSFVFISTRKRHPFTDLSHTFPSNARRIFLLLVSFRRNLASHNHHRRSEKAEKIKTQEKTFWAQKAFIWVLFRAFPLFQWVIIRCFVPSGTFVTISHWNSAHFRLIFCFILTQSRGQKAAEGGTSPEAQKSREADRIGESQTENATNTRTHPRGNEKPSFFLKQNSFFLCR